MRKLLSFLFLPLFFFSTLLFQWLFFFRLTLFFILFYLFIFNWSIITLLYSVSFCCTTAWISYVYVYIPSLLSLPSKHPTRSLQVIREHQAELLVLCNNFPLAVCFTHRSIYMAMLLSQFIPWEVIRPPRPHLRPNAFEQNSGCVFRFEKHSLKTLKRFSLYQQGLSSIHYISFAVFGTILYDSALNNT